MMRTLIFLAAFLPAAAVTVSAQMKRTIYQTFEIDSAKSVVLDLVGFTDIEVIAWAGNTILSEVNIEIYDASPEILKYFVDQGRYKFAFERKEKQVRIATEVRERKVIKTKVSGPSGCQESVSLRMFVPDNYYWSAVLEGDSDGIIKLAKDDFLQWESGQKNSDNVESYEDTKKHKLIKTLRIKE